MPQTAVSRYNLAMPEMPEVETAVRALRPAVVGRTITTADSFWPRQIQPMSLPAFQTRIANQTITALGRRGKYILFSLSGGDTMIIHLRMSGHLAVVDPTLPAHKHLRTVFQLDNGQEMRFRDQRKFGRIYLVTDPDEIVGKLGPEPLTPDFTPAALQERLNGRSRMLKPLLLDQGFVAGIGNIYADEALFTAKLHPQRTADSLTAAEVARLHGGIVAALSEGIAREGASIELYVKPDGTKGDMQNAVNVFRRQGEPCKVCGGMVQRIRLNGRATHFCPVCQPLKP